MTKEATTKGNNIFTYTEIDQFRIAVVTSAFGNNTNNTNLIEATKKFNDTDALIEVMRTECYLTLKGPKLYQLQTY